MPESGQPSDNEPSQIIFPDSVDKPRWEALMRGQIISVSVNKFFNYVQLVDNKAQAMIILNSVLIPVTINWMENDKFHLAAMISVLTAIFSIMTAIIAIYPKRRAGRKPDGTLNLLHFGDIGRLKEADFLAEFLPIYNDPGLLAEAAIKDLHDTARRIIRPKFFWLKISYITFFLGNLIAIALTVYSIYLQPSSF